MATIVLCNGLSRLSNEIVRLHLCCNKLTQDFKLVNQLVLLYPKTACAQDLYDVPASTFNTPLKYCCSQWSLPSN